MASNRRELVLFLSMFGAALVIPTAALFSYASKHSPAVATCSQVLIPPSLLESFAFKDRHSEYKFSSIQVSDNTTLSPEAYSKLFSLLQRAETSSNPKSYTQALGMQVQVYRTAQRAGGEQVFQEITFDTDGQSFRICQSAPNPQVHHYVAPGILDEVRKLL